MLIHTKKNKNLISFFVVICTLSACQKGLINASSDMFKTKTNEGEPDRPGTNVEKYKCKYHKYKNKYLELKDSIGVPKKEKSVSLREEETKSDSTPELCEYDLRFGFSSFCSGKWPFYINNMSKEIYENIKVVAVLGPENAGKSTLLSLILNKLLESIGDVDHTRGIDGVFDPKACIFYSDTEGLNTPSKIAGIIGKDADNILRDRSVTDAIMRDFIFKIGSVVILVFGDYTISTQKMYETLRKKCFADQKLIVVHNFKNIKNHKDVYFAFNNSMTYFSDPQPTKLNIPKSEHFYWVHKQPGNANVVTHLVMGSIGKGCDDLNSASIKFLKKFLDVNSRIGTLNMKAEFIKFIVENQMKYFCFKDGKYLNHTDFYFKKHKLCINKDRLDNVLIRNINFDSIENINQSPAEIKLYTNENNDCLVTIELLESYILEKCNLEKHNDPITNSWLQRLNLTFKKTAIDPFLECTSKFKLIFSDAKFDEPIMNYSVPLDTRNGLFNFSNKKDKLKKVSDNNFILLLSQEKDSEEEI